MLPQVLGTRNSTFLKLTECLAFQISSFLSMSSYTTHPCPKAKDSPPFSLRYQQPYFLTLPGTVVHYPIRDSVLWILFPTYLSKVSISIPLPPQPQQHPLPGLWNLNWPFCHNCLISFFILCIATEITFLSET